MPLETQILDAAPKGPAAGRRRQRWLLSSALAVVAIGLLAMLALIMDWCNQPAEFDVAAVTATALGVRDHPPAPGSAVTASAIAIGTRLLDKPGGFLYNDVMPPGALLDHCPSWECGTLMALRDLVRALRNDFSRSQTQSIENPHAKRADLQLAIDPNSWLLPAAETQYRAGIRALGDYLAQLNDAPLADAPFYPRSDNLADYLAIIEKRLGNFAARLSAGDALVGGLATATEPLAAPTAANEIDNVFYCARGYSWALLHIAQALSIDFKAVLADKQSQAVLENIARDLRNAIKPMHSPIVLNGRGYGLLANHSLVIASYIARVNAAIIDLRLLLQQG